MSFQEDIKKNGMPPTVICDLDGTIFADCNSLNKAVEIGENQKLLDGVAERFEELGKLGATVVFMTARAESHREETVKLLKKNNLWYTHLIMNVTPGVRVLLNDQKDGINRAAAINLEKDQGLSHFSFLHT